MTSEPLTERVPFMANPSLVAKLDAAAKECGISRSELIRRRLEVDPVVVRDALRWQCRSAEIAEQRDDTRPRPVPVVGAAYGPLPPEKFAFAGHVIQATYVDETTEITPELAEAISGVSTKMPAAAELGEKIGTLAGVDIIEVPEPDVDAVARMQAKINETLENQKAAEAAAFIRAKPGGIVRF